MIRPSRDGIVAVTVYGPTPILIASACQQLGYLPSRAVCETIADCIARHPRDSAVLGGKLRVSWEGPGEARIQRL